MKRCFTGKRIFHILCREAAANSSPDVTECACIYNEEKKQIVLFYEGVCEEKALGKYLKGALPEYMLPQRRYRLEKMPKNLNGKLDRKKLKEILPECEANRRKSKRSEDK